MSPAALVAVAVVWFILTCAAVPVAVCSSDVELDPILISPYRSSLCASRISQHVDVITRQELAALPARNAAEAVKYTTGVDLQERGSFGRASSVSLQGSESRQVRVMVDGIPFNTQSSGQVNLSLFPIGDIERIELITGPASSAWGSALGGVINIVTKDPPGGTPFSGALRRSWAEFRTSSESVQGGGEAGGLGYYALAEYQTSGGRGLHDDVLEKKGFAKTTYRLPDRGELLAEFGYSGGDVNSGVFPDESWQSQPYRARYGKVSLRLEGDAFSLIAEGKHSRQAIITRFFAARTDQDFYLETKTRDHLYQFSLGGVYRWPNGVQVGAGFDNDYDIVKSDLYLPKAKHVKVQAPYVNALIPAGPFDFNAGARYDRNSEYGDQVSPSLGAVWHIQSVRDGKLRLSAARAFTAPPLLWKYNYLPAFGVGPNPALNPERSWAYEAGAEGRMMKRLFASLLLYRADVSDGIAQGTDEAGNTIQKNFQRFRRQGAAVRARIEICPWLDAYAGAAFNDIFDPKADSVVQGNGAARQSFDYGLDVHNAAGTKLGIRAYYYYWNALPSSRPRDKRTLCDLRVSQTYKWATFFLNVYNLGNTKYWEDYFFPDPGRYFEGGLNLTW